ncbi:MAG: hypothetical protein OQK82_00285 [Candidatus Pacearchaeota archaeon]|nr:hypothetical protein [Candidatus Pacearchaeota archaeon]
MPVSDNIFDSKIKYNGIFDFGAFYQFCYDWLGEEFGLSMSEGKYSEKLEGNGKNVDIEWKGMKKMGDFFAFEVKVKFKIIKLEKVEINQGGIKTSTNKGTIEVGVKGNLIHDRDGKFEKNSFQMFLRSIYEKWIIPSRIDAMEGKLFGDCDTFLNQAKAFLDLEGKK